MNKMVEFKAGAWTGYNASLFLKALSDTHLPNADLVIRESLQNSFDAKAKDQIPVNFSMKGFFLTEDNKRFIASILPVTNSPVAKSLVSKIQSHDTYCLQIRDSNSVGLNGPYQEYDDITNRQIEASEYNYRDFVWSMGGSKDQTKGGSFGVGKTSLFLVSKVKTVCIYSRTIYNGKPQSRFIIKSFYPYSFDSTQVKQYWFSCERIGGCPYNNNVPLPFLDEDADYLAKNFGMDVFPGNETGTCSLILDVDFNSAEEDKTEPETFFVKEFPKKINHWFWTKLSPDIPKNKQIDIHLYNGDVELELEDSSDPSSPFFPFNRCLELWRNNYSRISFLSEKEKVAYTKGSNFIPVALAKPKVMLGAVTYVKVDATKDLIEEFFPGDSNLCLARMRDVEFCLNYQNFTYPKIESGKVVFALFHTDPKSWDGGEKDQKPGAVDAAFRKSENKTHEEWIEQSVELRDRTYVRIGNSRTISVLESMFGQKNEMVTTQEVSGALSMSLGRFLPYGVGFGASNQIGGDGKNQKEGKKVAKTAGHFRLIGHPVFLLGGWRKVRCAVDFSMGITSELRVYPTVSTVDGRPVRESIADNRVKIKSVSYGETENTQRESVPIGPDGSIKIPRKGCYVFSIEVFGDVDFDLKLVRKGNS